MQEEIFGPILPVLEFDKLDDAMALLRDRPTPLALYLFTNERATQERVLAETRSGGVCLNDTGMHMIGNDLPFGGLGESGLGRITAGELRLFQSPAFGAAPIILV